MLTHGVLQLALDHIHHIVQNLTAHGVALFAAKFSVKFAAKSLAIVAVKWLIVRISPRHLLARFMPTWLPPTKTEVPALPPIERR